MFIGYDSDQHVRVLLFFLAATSPSQARCDA